MQWMYYKVDVGGWIDQVNKQHMTAGSDSIVQYDVLAITVI